MRSLVFGFLIFSLLGCGADISNRGLDTTMERGSRISSSGMPVPLRVIREELDSPEQIVTDQKQHQNENAKNHKHFETTEERSAQDCRLNP